MTGIPQDVRSPIQQSRWVEAVNNGSSEVPAHGVCEVTANTVVAAEYREMLAVTRPTSYGLPNIVVNGPVPIPVGKKGWVTWDFPASVLGTSLSTGHMAGTATGSYSLAKGYPGVMILGDGPVSGTYRCEYLWCPVVRGTLGADLCPADATATIATSWVAVVDLGITTANNAFSLAGPSGSAVELSWNGQANAWEVLQVKHRVHAVVTDISKGTCEIDKTKLNKVALMYCETDVTTVAVQFYSKTFLTSLSLGDSISGSGSGASGGCGLVTNSITVCVLDDASPNGAVASIVFEPVVVLQSMRQTGLCLEGKIITVYVPCADTGEWVNLLCGTDCASGSGSGSGS